MVHIPGINFAIATETPKFPLTLIMYFSTTRFNISFYLRQRSLVLLVFVPFISSINILYALLIYPHYGIRKRCWCSATVTHSIISACFQVWKPETILGFGL